MQPLRQLGVGVIIAIVSIVLVLGGIFLSLAESLPPPATPTQIPATFPFSFPTPTATLLSIETLTETASPSPTATIALFPTVISQLPASCTPPAGWIRITAATGDTTYSLAQRYKTSADSLSIANCLSSADLPAGFVLYVPPVPTVTVIPCGAPAGWVRAHTVQSGDNLYRIALSYGITYPQLQRANCMGSSTTIYAGQRLWVPNLPTRTPVPGVTSIPQFPTDTPLALPTATSSATELPTSIPTAIPTDLPTATATPTVLPASQSQ